MGWISRKVVKTGDGDGFIWRPIQSQTIAMWEKGEYKSQIGTNTQGMNIYKVAKGKVKKKHKKKLTNVSFGLTYIHTP